MAMETQYFEDFEIDEQYETRARTITDADLMQYAGLSGNYHPIHLDEERMKDSEYEGRLVNGLLVLCMMQGQKIQTGMLEDSVVAFYGIENLRFTAPIYIGDTIHSEITVKDLEDRDESSGILTLEEKGVNQDGEPVVVATTKTVVRKRPT